MKQQKADSYEEIDEILHHQGLPFVHKAIWIELISHYHNDLLAAHFGIEKTCKLLVWKYYQPTLCHDVEAYVKGCDVCLASKAVRHKPYGDFQLLPVLTHWWKNLLINCVTGLPVSIDGKRDNYDSILVIVDQLTKMIHYKLVKIILDAPGLIKVIIDLVMRHHGFPNLIVTNWSSLFTSKFFLLLCYFLGIKQRLSTTFHPQTDSLTERQNSTIEAYL